MLEDTSSPTQSAGPTSPTPASAFPPPKRPRAAFTATAVAAIAAAAALSWDRPGIGWPLTALVVAAAILAAVRSAQRSAGAGRVWSGRAAIRAAWAVAAGMLIAVGALRAADGCSSCAPDRLLRWLRGPDRSPVDRRSPAVPAAGGRLRAGRTAMAGRDGIRARRHDHHTSVRTFVAGLIAAAMLVVFGALLVTADVAFAHVLSTMVSSLDGGTLLRWIWSATVTVTVTATAAHLLLIGRTASENKPGWGRSAGRVGPTSRRTDRPVRRFRRGPDHGPVGGGRHVLATAGLTYANTPVAASGNCSRSPASP